MKAMLVIQAKDGYAVAPYTGDVPADFVQEMTMAECIRHSYGHSVATVLQNYFEPPAQLKEAA